jgi:hypothetical protein
VAQLYLREVYRPHGLPLSIGSDAEGSESDDVELSDCILMLLNHLKQAD